MSVVNEFPAAAFDAASDQPTVVALRPIIEATWNQAAKHAENLGVVREAEANAAKAVETSENEAAVLYRARREQVAAYKERLNAELQAAIEAVKAQFKEQTDKATKGDSVLSELKTAAIQEEKKSAVAGLDTSVDAEGYETAIKTLRGLASAVTAIVPALADSLKLPTITQVIKGGKSQKDAEKSGWRPRYDAIAVNGEAVEGVEGKSGKVTVTLTEAAKALGKGWTGGALLTDLNDAMGNSFDWGTVTLNDGSFTFKTSVLNGNGPHTVTVWPAVKVETETEDVQDSDNVPSEY